MTGSEGGRETFHAVRWKENGWIGCEVTQTLEALQISAAETLS